MKDHLGPAIVSIIEVLIGGGRLFERKLMRDDRRRICLAEMDKIPKVMRVSAIRTYFVFFSKASMPAATNTAARFGPWRPVTLNCLPRLLLYEMKNSST